MKVEFSIKPIQKSCSTADDYPVGLYRDARGDLVIVAEDSSGSNRFVGCFGGRKLNPHIFDTDSRFTLTKLVPGDTVTLTQEA